MRPIMLLAGAGLFLAPVADAQTPAPPDVAASALRALGLDQLNPLGAMLGQRPPFAVTEGDHIVVHRPIDFGKSIPLFVADDVTVRGRPIGDGRWWFDGATIPSTFAFGDASTEVSVKATLRTGGLAYHATLDPSHATETVEVATLPSAHAHVAILDTAPPKPAVSGAKPVPAMPIEFDIETGVVTATDRVTSEVAGFVRETGGNSVEHLVVTMPVLAPSARVTVGFIDDHDTTDLSPEGIRAITAAYYDFVLALKQAPGTDSDTATTKTLGKTGDAPPATLPPATLPPAALPPIRAMLATLRTAIHSVDSRTEADDIDVDLGDGTTPYHLDRLVLTGAGASVDGRLDILTGFELDGPRVPGLPAAYARLMPHKILIRPRLGGINVDDLLTTLGTVLDTIPGGEAAGEEAGRALVHKLAADGTLSLGLDKVVVEFADASLAGSGTLRFASDDPAAVSATADLSVTGIDAITAELAAHAETKDTIAPLALLKGLGRQDGTVMTWHMDFSGGKLTVNGQDVTAMFTSAR